MSFGMLYLRLKNFISPRSFVDSGTSASFIIHFDVESRFDSAHPLTMRLSNVLSGVLLITTIARAENWPEWRGPTRDGVTLEKNIPLKWSATENVKWKVHLPDRGNSTPVN